MTYVFMYRLTNDSGFAPCVDDGLFSLVCCKGGKGNIRYWIGTGKVPSRKLEFDYCSDIIYVLGLYREQPKTEPNFLYLARITDVQEMTDYFQGIGKSRQDGIYDCIEGQLKRNEKYPGTHETDWHYNTDVNGKYALLSNDFIYLGKDTVHLDIIDEYLKKYNFTNKSPRGTRIIEGDDAEKLVAECLKLRDGIIHEPHK